jgi:hypothetical protein
VEHLEELLLGPGDDDRLPADRGDREALAFEEAQRLRDRGGRMAQRRAVDRVLEADRDRDPLGPRRLVARPGAVESSIADQGGGVSWIGWAMPSPLSTSSPAAVLSASMNICNWVRTASAWAISVAALAASMD